MQIKYFSKVDTSRLLHTINKVEKFEGRIDLSDPKNFIQLAILNQKKGDTYKAHMHLWKKVTFKEHIAQESWVILRGSIKIFFYDLDKKLLATEILSTGDSTLTFEGGHTYEVLEDQTLMYEMKTGPYEGREKDKIFIEV
jgi:hypothetical protein